MEDRGTDKAETLEGKLWHKASFGKGKAKAKVRRVLCAHIRGTRAAIGAIMLGSALAAVQPHTSQK